MPTDHTPVRSFPTTTAGETRPDLRKFAREALDVTRFTSEQGVLQRRYGQCLLNHLRRYRHEPSTSLDLIPRLEREWILSVAGDLIQINAALDGIARPTAHELQWVHQRKVAGLARARAKVEAERLGHNLGDFGESNLDGYEEAMCTRCDAKMTLHLDTGTLQSAPELKASCKRRWPK